MWIFTKHGFFSVVCARVVENDVVTNEVDHRKMMIRSRDRNHLENLKSEFPNYLGNVEIHSDYDTDYAYRIFVNKTQWMYIIESLADDIDYSNFKNEAKKHGADEGYLNLLAEVWLDGFEFQERDQRVV